MIQIENYWLLLLVVLTSLGVASFYYFKILNKTPSIRRFIFALLRFFTVFALLFLLLSPIIEWTTVKDLKPKVVILVDNSSSIQNSKIPILEYKKEIFNIQSNLQKNGFQTEIKIFDKEIRDVDSLDTKGNHTDIYSAIQTILESNTDENLKSLLLITDGNYNLGNNPTLIQNPNFVEINTVLLGDTSKIADIKLESVESNPVMLSNESAMVHVNISALKSQNNLISLLLEDVGTGRVLSSKKISTQAQSFNENVQFQISNLPKGKHHLRVKASSGLNEINLRNNSHDFYIDVVDGMKRIEILSNFPHPDLSVLQSILNKNKSFQVNVKIADIHTSFNPLSDLVILYQIPNNFQANKTLIDQLNNTGKSVLYILGTQSQYSLFNQLQSSYEVSLKGNISQDYFPVLNNNFSKFYLQEKTTLCIPKLSPLSNNLLTISTKNEAYHLLNARIGSITTEQPLVSISYQSNQMIGLIAGENIWKWKISNFLYSKSTDEIQDMFEKLINFLAIKKDKKQLVVSTSEPLVYESDNIKIYANTYNELFQPIQPTSISCRIINQKGMSLSYDMIAQDNTFVLSPQGLKSGHYTYQVDAVINGKKFQESSSFSVQADDVESQYLPSNLEEMQLLSDKNHGQLFFWNHYQTLFSRKMIYENKMVSESRKMKANDIVVILLLLLISLGAEWILRKYYGLH